MMIGRAGFGLARMVPDPISVFGFGGPMRRDGATPVQKQDVRKGTGFVRGTACMLDCILLLSIMDMSHATASS